MEESFRDRLGDIVPFMEVLEAEMSAAPNSGRGSVLGRPQQEQRQGEGGAQAWGARQTGGKPGAGKATGGAEGSGAADAKRRKQSAAACHLTPKAELHRVFQKKGLHTQLVFDTHKAVDERGVAKSPPEFICNVTCPSYFCAVEGCVTETTYTASGSSKKACEHDAARKALVGLGFSEWESAMEVTELVSDAVGTGAAPSPAVAPSVELATECKVKSEEAKAGSLTVQAVQSCEIDSLGGLPDIKELQKDPDLLLQSYIKVMNENRALRQELEAERKGRSKDRDTLKKSLLLFAMDSNGT